MPITLPVSQLEPGMCLSKSIENKYNILLSQGRILTQEDIEALTKRFPAELVQIGNPILDDLVEFDDTSSSDKISKEVRKAVSKITEKISCSVRNGVVLNANNVTGLKTIVNNLMAYMSKNPVAQALVEQSNGWDDYIKEHNANVFYLSMVIGNTIRNYVKTERHRQTAASKVKNAMDLTPLAFAALLKDIALADKAHLLTKTKPLTPSEIAMIRMHPLEGARLIPNELHPMVKSVVRTHHENMNGTGYPEGVSGNKISIFARIIRIADAYSAAISTNTFKKAKPTVQVLYDMIYGSYKTYYDPLLLKVLASIISPFPCGAKLELSDGQFAVVTKHNPKNPFKPQVIIAFDKNNEPIIKAKLEEPFYLNERKEIEVFYYNDQDISFINNCNQGYDSLEIASTDCSQIFNLTYP